MKRVLGMSVLLCAAGSAWSAETIRYVALVAGGKQAGQQVVVHGDDGITRVDYIFKDNGRGPEIKEEFTLAEDGTFKTYQVRGTSEMGAPIDESFSRSGDQVRWKSTSDQGGQAVSGTAQYSTLDGSFAETSVMIAALAKRADGKLPLLPAGTLTMRKVADAQVMRGKDEQTVQLLALTGVGFTPRFVWATSEVAPRLFARIYPGWMQLIEDGWQGNAAALEARQVQAEGEVLVDMAKRLGHPLAGSTLIRNARVFDSEHATLGLASNVLIKDGRIVSIGDAAARTADHVFDAGGRVLLPGLFDMHGHVDRWSGGLNLASGVTTVRDMGNSKDMLQAMAEEEKDGRLMTPNIVPAGFIEGESAMSAQSDFVVKDFDGARKAVDWYAAHGYPQIKIYNSFPKEHLRETVAYAHGKGMRVSGHVPAFMRAQDVVEQGYDEIQHINQVLLNFFVKPDTDTRTLQRFYLVADNTAGLDFDSKPVQDFIALLASRQVVIDPTLAVFNDIPQRAGQMHPAYAAIADHLPPGAQRGFRVGSFNIPDDATALKYTKSYDKMVEFVGRMYRAGVPIVAGTDALAGFALQRELELYVQAGMTPAQALQVATWNGAKYSRVLDDRGSIVAGKRADLVLVDGDPTTNISDIRKVALVIKGGQAYYPSEIHDALGIKPFVPPVTLQAAPAR
ncbi:MAG: amidohydrolase family protein [Luteimonas sp.]